jgi:uncharacterized protein YegP (UPF0339 family)
VKFIIWQDAKGEWRWTLRARNGRIVADSSEGYHSRRSCVAMCVKINHNIPRESAA